MVNSIGLMYESYCVYLNISCKQNTFQWSTELQISASIWARIYYSYKGNDRSQICCWVMDCFSLLWLKCCMWCCAWCSTKKQYFSGIQTVWEWTILAILKSDTSAVKKSVRVHHFSDTIIMSSWCPWYISQYETGLYSQNPIIHHTIQWNSIIFTWQSPTIRQSLAKNTSINRVLSSNCCCSILSNGTSMHHPMKSEIITVQRWVKFIQQAAVTFRWTNVDSNVV